MRGEYTINRSCCTCGMELPPHARRIRATDTTITMGRGTTSACAENTILIIPRQNGKRNYLRMRGEYKRTNRFTRLRQELPPHARRIPQNVKTITDAVGTTSACAENTQRICRPRRQWRNYLRMRGEYDVPHYMNLTPVELPPHARRIHRHATHHVWHTGTTSACAENTSAHTYRWRTTRNYLRMRGEYSDHLLSVYTC